jgi:phosphate:Na+ symporter
MFGMDAMSGAVSGLKDNPTFTQFITTFSNPVLGVLVGAIFTAIIQSSSASVGVLQALSMSCFIPYSSAIPVIMGQNIGTTITPIISSVSGNMDSKRVAVTCLYIKIASALVVGGVFYAIQMIFPFEFMNTEAGPMGVALVHTLFNVFSTLLLMPFSKFFVCLATKTFKEKETEKRDDFAALDERFLDMPTFAVEMTKELVNEMASLALISYKKAVSLLDCYDESVFLEVLDLEKRVDKYEDKTGTYLVKIAKKQMSSEDSKRVTELLHCIGNIERISDHALNIAETASENHKKGKIFSQNAKEDLLVVSDAVEEILSLANASLANENLILASKVEPLEQVIDLLKKKVKHGHSSRLVEGDCTLEMGFHLSDILTDLERISDHCSNIAVCFIEMAKGTLDTHEYLNGVKAGGEKNFNELFDFYSRKYLSRLK